MCDDLTRDQAGRRENSFQQPVGSSGSAESGQILPSAILDTNDELTNLYKTISRKQILSKVQCSSFSGSHPHHPHPHHHLHHHQQQAQSPENSRDSR